MGKLEGGSVYEGPHNFISLGAPKGHNPALITGLPLSHLDSEHAAAKV